MIDNHFGSVDRPSRDSNRIIPCSCREESETTKISRPWQRADLFEESEKNESASVKKQVCDGKWRKRRVTQNVSMFFACAWTRIFFRKWWYLASRERWYFIKTRGKKNKKKEKKTIRKKSLRLQLKRSNKRALKFYSRFEPLEDIYDVLLRALRHLGDTLSVVFCLSSYAKISPRKKRYRGGNREANRQKTTLPPLFSILSSLSTTRNCVQKFSIAATLQDRTQGRWFNRGNYVRLFAKGWEKERRSGSNPLLSEKLRRLI